MYLGDYALGATVHGAFATRLASGARGNFSDALETADLRVYKNGSATQRSSESGYTVTSNTFDSLDGIVTFAIDLSDNTDAGFYAPGEYVVVLYPSETLDSLSVSNVVGTFSIMRTNALMPVAGLAQGGTSTTVQLPSTASSSDGAYAGASVWVRHSAGAIEMFPQASTAYVGSTRTVTIDGTFSDTVDTTTYVAVFLGPVAGTAVLPDVNVASVTTDAIDAAAVATDLITEIVTAIFARTYEATKMSGMTFEELTGLMGSVLLGKVSGLPTAPVFRNLGDTANAVSATTDSTGNRTAVTKTLGSVR